MNIVEIMIGDGAYVGPMKFLDLPDKPLDQPNFTFSLLDLDPYGCIHMHCMVPIYQWVSLANTAHFT